MDQADWAEQVVREQLPHLSGPQWNKTCRLLQRPETFTFLDRLHEGLRGLQIDEQELGGVLRGCWRASSLVEGINSVARMHQSRHRRMTQGLLDLKRLYWNMRAFRTGRRRGKSPYALLGVKLPTDDSWQLLKLPPDQLAQHLSTQ